MHVGPLGRCPKNRALRVPGQCDQRAFPRFLQIPLRAASLQERKCRTSPATEDLPVARQRTRVGAALERLSQTVSQQTGTSRAFLVALGVVLVWALLGPIFHF